MYGSGARAQGVGHFSSSALLCPQGWTNSELAVRPSSKVASAIRPLGSVGSGFQMCQVLTAGGRGTLWPGLQAPA